MIDPDGGLVCRGIVIFIAYLGAHWQSPDQRELIINVEFSCSKTLTSSSTIRGVFSMDAISGKRLDGIADHDMIVCGHHFQTCKNMRVLRSYEAGPSSGI